MRTYYIDYLIVGGGGGGASAPQYNGGGGGGGEVRIGGMLVPSTFSVTVGQGGAGGSCNSKAPDGCPSCLWWLRANGGGGGDARNVLCCCRGAGKSGTNYWWSSECYCGSILCYGAGGGGAGTNSVDHLGGYGINGYGGGGNGSTNYSCTQESRDGGGLGISGSGKGCNATNYGGGGGGGNYGCCGGAGCQGVVDICYPADGSFGFTTATGGNSCYLCNGICVHRFTSNGTFTIVS